MQQECFEEIALTISETQAERQGTHQLFISTLDKRCVITAHKPAKGKCTN